MVCDKCRATIPDGLAFCDQCGAKQRVATGPRRRFTIGRDENAAIRLDFPMVSGEHCAIKQEEGTTWLKDLNSRNGTFLDAPKGRPVGANWVSLSGHDAVYLGSHRVPVSLLNSRLTSPKSQEFHLSHSPSTRRVMVAGRDPSCDIVIDSPQVSRRHTEFRREPNGWRVIDLRSSNGTWIGGRRIRNEIVTKDTELQLGSYSLKLHVDGSVALRPMMGHVRLDVMGVNRTIQKTGGGGPLRLLRDVSFSVYPSEIVGIMGPSGAGKTTLLMALTGDQPADTGAVEINGANLYRNFQRFRGLLGYVPQDDIVHPDLTVFQALFYAARLRLPPDTTDTEIQGRVMKTLGELHLSHRKDTRVGDVTEKTLSGGERKRVNLGMELVTDPLVLIADEPTSGLSAHDSLEVIQALRNIADKGRPVLLTIHQPSGSLYRSLNLAMVLGKGGFLTYYGPPEPNSYEAFGATIGEPETIMTQLETRHPEQWVQQYQRSDNHKVWITERIAERGRKTATGKTPRRMRDRAASMPFLPFLARTFRLKLGRLSAMLRYLVVPLVVGLLTALFFNDLKIDDERAKALFFLVLSSLFCGVFNSFAEIVSERAIYRRERMTGLSIEAYLAAKVIVLSVITIGQMLMLTGMALVFVDLEGSAAGLLLTMVLSGISSVCLGLFLSTLVARPESASMPMIIVVVIELMASGFVVALPEEGKFVYAPIATRWSVEAALDNERAGLAELDRNQSKGPCIPTIDTIMEKQRYNTGERTVCFLALMILSFVFLVAAAIVLRIRDPVILKFSRPAS